MTSQIFKLGQGLWAAFADPRVLSLLSLTVTIIAIASVFYHHIEGWAWIDSIYFSVITISTVGYGDFSPQTSTGKVFTIGYILVGIGIFVAAATSIADVLLSKRDNNSKD